MNALARRLVRAGLIVCAAEAALVGPFAPLAPFAKSRQEKPISDAQDAKKHFDLGRAAYMQKQFQAAVAEFQQAVAKDGTRPEYRFQLAMAWFSVGDWKNAEEASRFVFEQDGTFWDAALLHGSALGELGRFDEAIAVFESLAQNPACTMPEKAWVNIGKLYEKLNTPDKAVEAYRSALRVKPNYPPAHYGLAQALEKANRLTDALEQYRIAGETYYQNSPEFQYRYGVACFRHASDLETQMRETNRAELAGEIRRWKSLAAERLETVVRKAPGTTESEQAEGLLKLIR